MKYNYVIFDLDGTLLDTSKGILEAIDFTIRYMNLPDLPDETKHEFIGPPIYESFAKYYELSSPETELATEIFRNAYKTKYLFNAVPYDGIFRLLTDLKNANIKLAVATNKRDDYAQELLHYFGFQKYFDFMLGSDLKNEMKKKDIVEKCLKYFAVKDRRKAVLVGDTIHDFSGACSCNIDFMGVMYGFGLKKEEEINMIKLHRIFMSVVEMEKFLLNNLREEDT